jgi:hypothetical protein
MPHLEKTEGVVAPAEKALLESTGMKWKGKSRQISQ